MRTASDILLELPCRTFRLVNLSGGYGDKLAKGVQNMKGNYKDRFIVFANIDSTRLDEPGSFGMVEFRNGSGAKIQLGLQLTG